MTVYLSYPSDIGHRFLTKTSTDVLPGCCIYRGKSEYYAQ